MQVDWLLQVWSNALYVILGAGLSLASVFGFDAYKNWKLKKHIRKILRAELTLALTTLQEEILYNVRGDSPVKQLHFEGPYSSKFPLSTTFYNALSYQIHTHLNEKELVSLEAAYNTIRHFNAAYFRKLLTTDGLYVTVHVQPTRELVQQIEGSLRVLGAS